MNTGDKLLLHRAAARGDLKVVQELVATGWDIEREDEDGTTPLLEACFKGQTEVAGFLIGQGADVNHANKVHYTPLMTACTAKRLEVVRLLLKSKANPELAADFGKKAAHCALMGTIPFGSSPFETETHLIELLKALQAQGADLNTKGGKGETPLMDAAWWGLTKVTEYLLSCGAVPDARDDQGRTAADYARMRIAKNLGADENHRCERAIEILTRRDRAKWWMFWR